MNIVIRADASVKIGTGHVMRCMTLAEELTGVGAEVMFICRTMSGNLQKHIEKKGYVVHMLPPADHQSEGESNGYGSWLEVEEQIDAEQTIQVIKQSQQVDWLIVDHYAIGASWERKVKKQTACKVMVIDDLANRLHDCDLLLDQNEYPHKEERYKGLIPKKCATFLGANYVLLRREFRDAKKNIAPFDRRYDKKRMFIFFGGSDATKETEKALIALEMLTESGFHFEADIVVGRANERKKQIEEMCAKIPRVIYHCDIDYVASLMIKADIGLGAGGATTWERWYLKLPTLIITTADNQTEVAEAADRAGAAIHLGESGKIHSKDIATKLQEMIFDSENYERVFHHLFTGTGTKIGGESVVPYLVGEELLAKKRTEYLLKPLTMDELALVLSWRNSPRIQQAMFHDEQITMEEHVRWYRNVNQDDTIFVRMLSYKGKPLGLVHFSKINKKNKTASWGFYIGEANTPRGAGTMLGILALEIAFEEHQLRKISAEVLQHNEPSLRFHEKLGFKEEGRLKQHVVKGGAYEDVILLAVFYEEWVDAKKNLLNKWGKENERN